MMAMQVLTRRLAALIARARYGSREPVIAGMHGQGGPPVFAAQGLTGTGEPVGPGTLVYAASLSKQITAGCAALLVHEGALDMEDTLARWLPGLPDWAGTVRLRHLLHHTAGMPDARVDAIIGGTADRTSAAALSALAQVRALAAVPGTAHAYSGAGYICLAAAVERAAGQPLPEFAAQRVFIPLGMSSTCYWPGPAPAPPGAAPLAAVHPAPLSLGDGGVWSTARDLLRWGQALNADELGISQLMQTEGSLDDGTPVGYAWGLGVRSHGGYRVYRHGGGWPGLRALLARVPDLGQSLVIIALADDSERRTDLADSMLGLVADVNRREDFG
jgi:CubicO group peptidase (beta-lactamase class C family)